MDLRRLKEPFAEDEIEWRIGQSGKRGEAFWAKVLAYLTNRAIQDRLDEVCGPDNWWNEYKPGPQGGVICGLTIRTEHGPVTKWDGAENTDIEQVKGGLSDAMKRAAVQWGIGRYLYNLGETWADCTAEKQKGNGWHWAKTKDGSFYWKAPGLPKDFLPAAEQKTPAAKPPANRTAAKPAPAPSAEPDPYARGDDGNWRQWTEPPAEVGDDETHAFWCQAVKGLMHHAGAKSTKPLRAICNWLGPEHDPAAVLVHPVAAHEFWVALMEKSNTVPFTRMLYEANRAAEAVA